MKRNCDLQEAEGSSDDDKVCQIIKDKMEKSSFLCLAWMKKPGKSHTYVACYTLIHST